jgi:hypothetical protein
MQAQRQRQMCAESLFFQSSRHKYRVYNGMVAGESSLRVIVRGTMQHA